MSCQLHAVLGFPANLNIRLNIVPYNNTVFRFKAKKIVATLCCFIPLSLQSINPSGKILGMFRKCTITLIIKN